MRRPGRGLNDVALAQLKQKWGTMQKVLSSQSRLKMIVDDILLDMDTKPRLLSGRGNAMLVSGSIYQACKFYELFTSEGFDRCAIVTSYKPSTSDIKGEETGEGLTERLRQFDIYNKMLDGKDPETFEKEAREEIKALCEPVAPPKYIRYFCAKDTTDKDALKDNEPKRIALYKLTASLIRAFANLANEMPEAGYTAEEVERIKQEVGGLL